MSDLALVPEVVPSLAECEQVIENYRQSYVEAGQALRTIREARLYRDGGFSTFEDYVQDRSERWGFTKGRASQLESASDVFTKVNNLGLPAPLNERQARELVRIKDEDRQAEAWSEVIEKSEGRPTAKLVKEIVSQYVKPRKRRPAKPKPAKDDQAEAELTALLTFLYNTADRLHKLSIEPEAAAVQIPAEQLFRFDHLEPSIDWLIDFTAAIRQRRALPSEQEQQEHAAETGESIHG